MTLHLSPTAAVVLNIYNAHSSQLPSPILPLPSDNFDIFPQNRFSTLRALSHAPFLSTYQHSVPSFLSAEIFFEENPLLAATLKPATQQRYAIALDNFKRSAISQDEAPLSLDQRLSIYIQDRFLADPRPGQRQEMANLVCILLLMYPSIRPDVGLARRCLAGWRALKPAQAAAPLTKLTVLAFAHHMLQQHGPASAIVIVLSYSACLRVSEVLRLQWSQVALPGDIRLSSYAPGVAGLNIVDAKTSRYSGDMQFVPVTDLDAITMLSTLKASSAHPSQVTNVSYQTNSNHLKQAASSFGFPADVFTSHSARIGKATEDYISGMRVDQIAISGRCKSINSLRYYLNNGKAWILKNNISKTHQARLRHAAEQLGCLLETARQNASVA